MPGKIGREASVIKRRSDYGTVQATERDLFMLRWIGEQYAVRVDQLQRLATRMTNRQVLLNEDELSEPGIRRLYGRWVKAGWVETRKLLAQQPQWVWLTRKGLADSGLPYPYRVPSVARLNHIYAVNAARLYVEQKGGNQVHWKSERSINPIRKAAGKKHIVDGELFYQGKRIAVEVELTQKSRTRLDNILWELQGDYSVVYYYAATLAYQAVKEAIESLPRHEETFVLYRLEEVVR